ncbi:MAG: hypothetical protein WD425_02305 [Nitrospirales bacterium]
MASLTNKRFTATQYALLTSFMGIPRVFAGSTSGFLAAWLGWEKRKPESGVPFQSAESYSLIGIPGYEN